MTQSKIDHLVLAAASLKDGQDYVEDMLGVRPVFSGQHPQFGTENALLALGPGLYFEVIALQEGVEPEGPAPFGVSRDMKPTLTTWCARPFDMDAACAAARAEGVDMGKVVPAYRDRPDGVRLNWRFTDVSKNRINGLVPFLITWDGPHPSDDLPDAGRLQSLTLIHPEAERLSRIMTGQKLPVTVQRGERPSLQVSIRRNDGQTVTIG